MFLVIPARPPQCYGGWTNAGIHECLNISHLRWELVAQSFSSADIIQG